jgi:hypothetical protein
VTEIETAGGAILGYCAMGNDRIANAPTSMMRMAKTQAKIGRLIKKIDIKPLSRLSRHLNYVAFPLAFFWAGAF